MSFFRNKLTPKVIELTIKNMNDLQVKRLDKDVQRFEDVEKGELQLFLADLWDRYSKLERKYDCLCDKYERS